MAKQTTTFDTKYEYDGSGNLVHKVATETRDIPDAPLFSAECVCDDCAPIFENELEVEETPSVLDFIAGAAGVASIAASVFVIVRAIRAR